MKILKSGIFWTVFVGIIGFGLAIYFYVQSNKEREPVYAIKKEPSLIFNKDDAFPTLKLLTNDSIVIDKNVYIETFAIWNNGGLEISKSDVREDFTVRVPDGVQILDYKVVKETHPDISNFRVVPNGNRLTIDWDYFDPKFGFELQVIYAGKEKDEIWIDGFVLGNGNKKVEPFDQSTIKLYFWPSIITALIGALYLILRSIKRPLFELA